jgi:two-component system, NtrC family, sensor kinase
VSDNGPGMEAAHLDQIFEPFFTTKPIGQGTGLGLSISQDIIQRHGGTLTATSAPGEGTRIDIRLPLAEKKRAHAA